MWQDSSGDSHRQIPAKKDPTEHLIPYCQRPQTAFSFVFSVHNSVGTQFRVLNVAKKIDNSIPKLQ